jgi:signal transduction histidine kinase
MKTKKLTFLFFCILILFNQIVFAQQKKDTLEFYKQLVKNPQKPKDLTEAFLFFNENKEENLKKRDLLEAVKDLYYISRIEYKLDINYNSESSAVEGLKLLDSLKNDVNKDDYKISFYNHLGILKRNQKDFKTSKEYYSKALELAKSKKTTGIIRNNIGVAYKYLEEYDSAFVEFKSAYKINKEFGSKKELVRSLDNLGFIEAVLDKKEGISNMLKSIEMRRDIQDSDLYASFKHLTEYYLFKTDTIKALEYAKKGYEVAKEFNILSSKKDALSNLILLGNESYGIEFLKINSEIETLKLINENQYSLSKYNFEREKESRIKAELKEEKAKTQNILLLFSIVLIVFGSGFFFYILKNRHKKEKLKTRFDTERYISKKLHDEVANDVYSMMSRLENDPDVKKELIDDLEEVYLKTRDISKANAALDFSQDYDELLKDLISIYKTESVNIFTRNLSKISWDSISEIKKETLYRVIQELMTNMKKHSEATLVTLQFEEQKKKILVIYRDNGIGCELKYGNGLRNTENRIDLAGCRITFESGINKGFEANLIL